MKSIAIIGNIASLGYLIGKELRNRGFQVEHYCTYNVFTAMPEEKYMIKLDKVYNIPFERTMRKFWLRNAKSYDLELRLSAPRYVKSKNSVIIFNGSDLRDGFMKPEQRCFITTKDLYRFVEGYEAEFLPRCIDTALFKERTDGKVWREGEPLVIGHFPTEKRIKGTNLVLEAVERLKLKGHDCSLLSEIVPHERMPDYLSKVHVLCDWFGEGIFGIIAIEALAMGIPVVCYVKEEYFDYPEIKNLIVNCQPDAESIAEAILHAAKMEVNSRKAKELYSPHHTVDVLLKTLDKWKMLNG